MIKGEQRRPVELEAGQYPGLAKVWPIGFVASPTMLLMMSINFSVTWRESAWNVETRWINEVKEMAAA